MEAAGTVVGRRASTRAWVVPGCAVVFAVLFVAGMLTSGAASDTENKTNAEVLKTFRAEKTGAVIGAVPPWFWVLGYVAAVAMLGAVMFLPMVLLPIWAIGAAVVLKD